MIVNPILYQQGTKLPELTNPGSAADLLAGKQLVDQYGNPLTGTMPEVEQAVPGISIDANGLITASAVQEAGHVAAGTRSATKQLTKRDASSLSASGAAVTVPAGYYPSQVSKSVATAAHPKPTISRSGGTITAQHVQSAGYTSGGTTTETLSITTQSGKTVTPGTSRQTAVASGRLTTGAVYVAGDANLVAANIKSGVSIFGVAGSAETVEKIRLSVTNNSNSSISFIAGPGSRQIAAKNTMTVEVIKDSVCLIFSADTSIKISSASTGIQALEGNTGQFKVGTVNTYTGQLATVYLIFCIYRDAGQNESITIS